MWEKNKGTRFHYRSDVHVEQNVGTNMVDSLTRSSGLDLENRKILKQRRDHLLWHSSWVDEGVQTLAGEREKRR